MPLHVIDRIAVEDEGEGDAVVCVHGLGGSANTWSAMHGAFARKRVVKVELPGSARSKAGTDLLTVEGMAEAVARACGRLSIQRAHFVGHSMGTIVCQHVAVRHPRLVRSLSLMGPLIAPPDATRQAIRARGQAVAAGGPQAMFEVAQALSRAATSAHSRETNPLVAAFVTESLSRQDADGYARSCQALADVQGVDVSRLTAPCLLITGDEDAVAPPQAVRAMAEAIAQHHTRPSVHILPRCGHWTPIERPADCAREVRNWIGRQA